MKKETIKEVKYPKPKYNPNYPDKSKAVVIPPGL